MARAAHERTRAPVRARTRSGGTGPVDQPFRPALLYRLRVDIRTTLHWPAPPADVVAARCDPDYLDVLCRRTGAVEHDVQVDGLRTVVRRVMPTDRFPDFARKLTGERLTLVETTTWHAEPDADGSRRADVSMQVEGAPVTSSATAVVSAEGDGAVEQVDGQVTAKVPLVGGRIEKAVLPALEAALEAQVDAYREWAGR